VLKVSPCLCVRMCLCVYMCVPPNTFWTSWQTCEHHSVAKYTFLFFFKWSIINNTKHETFGKVFVWGERIETLLLWNLSLAILFNGSGWCNIATKHVNCGMATDHKHIYISDCSLLGCDSHTVVSVVTNILAHLLPYTPVGTTKEMKTF